MSTVFNIITITEDTKRNNNHNGNGSSALIIVSTVQSRFEHVDHGFSTSTVTQYYFPSDFMKTTVNISYVK